MGILWFGGPPNDVILPRHGYGPPPQVIGGADPLLNPKAIPPPPKAGDKAGDDKDPEDKADPKKESTITKLFKTIKGYTDNMSASRHLVVMNRQTGEVLWTASAKNAFRH